VWVHAQFKPIGVSTTTASRVRVTGVSFVLNGISYPKPDGLVTFDPAAPSVSTTMYEALKKRWSTTINPGFISDENFFVGTAIPVDISITGGGKATIRFTTQTDDPDMSFLEMERGGLHLLAVRLECRADPAVSRQRADGQPTCGYAGQQGRSEVAHPGAARWRRFELHRRMERNVQRRGLPVNVGITFDGHAQGSRRWAAR